MVDRNPTAGATLATMKSLADAIQKALHEDQDWILIVMRRVGDGDAVASFASNFEQEDREAIMREIVRQDTEGLTIHPDFGAPN